MRNTGSRGASALRFGVLGPLRVERDGQEAPVVGARQRRLLTVLLVNSNVVVSVDRLVDALWGETPPRTAENSLQVAVSKLRRALRLRSGDVLRTQGAGYVLVPEPGSIDAVLFERGLDKGRRANAAGDPVSAHEHLSEALGLWRGTPLDDVAYELWAQPEIVRLSELRLAALEERIEADLALGRHQRVVPELEGLVAEHPLRERLRALLALALYRCERQADALATIRDARSVLREELGIEPGEALDEMQRAILRRDVPPPTPTRRRDALDVETLPSGTVTFMLTDVEGSTRAWEREPEAMRRALTRHDDILADVVTGHGGTLIKSKGEGDSSFSVFIGAADAIGAAIDLQRSLVAERWPTSEALSVRTALHTGEAECRDGDYLGTAVNLCGRLRGAAWGGQTLVSEVTANIARGLVEDANLRDLGWFRLAGLEEPERIFEVVHPNLPSDPRPPRCQPVQRHNLPRELTSFVGRDHDVAEIRELVDAHPVITLTGPGGVGKTRIALQVATGIVDRFADGAWFVDLSSIAHPGEVPATIADVLGVATGTRKDTTERVIDHLGQRETLLIVDNCEHVLDAAAQTVGSISRACPRVTVLATSREPMGIQGEVARSIGGLPLPDEDQLEPTASDAVGLFVERARAACPDLRLDSEVAHDVAHLCRRLDGLPLAIELAASCTRAIGFSDLVEKLNERLGTLPVAARDRAPRHRSLEAIVAWSYDLLSDAERTLFQRLSVFVGGWPIEAAERVCGDDPLSGDQVLELTAGLVEKSMLVHEHALAGTSRYRMLETLRDFSVRRLAGSGELEAIRTRHLMWLADAIPARAGEDESTWRARVTPDQANIRQALAWAIESRGAEAGLTVALANEEIAVHADLRGGVRWLERLLATDEGANAELRARALRSAGGYAFMLGDWARCVQLLTEARELFSTAGDAIGAGWASLYLGLAAWGNGDLAAAEAIIGEAVAEARRLGDRAFHLRALTAACLWFLERDLERSTALAEEIDPLLHEFDAPLFDRAHAQEARAMTRLGRDDPLSAASLLEHALTLYWDMGSRTCGAHCLEMTAGLAVRLGDPAAGAELIASAEALRATTDDAHRPWEMVTLERTTSAIRVQLDAGAAAAATERGRALGFDAAIGRALQVARAGSGSYSTIGSSGGG